MDKKLALDGLAALSQETRLDVFRALVQAGPEGLSAGEIAERLGVVQNTLSSHLKKLEHAGLVSSQRHGRQIIYRADFAAVRALILFLMQDCCMNSREVCEPIAASLAC